MKKVNPAKIATVIIVAVLIALFLYFDLHHTLTLENIQARQDDFQSFYEGNRWLTIAVYMIVYIVVTALSLPGAAVMTLAGGALFGLGAGTIMVSFASTIGATLAFLVSRFLFRDFVQNRFGDKLRNINTGLAKEGAFYLFTLRLVPIFPFFVINLAMGLTPIRTIVFYLVSQVGMLPGTIVYINAGTQLGNIESLNGLVSPGLIFSFVLLGLFPLLAKKIVTYFRTRRIMAPYPKPRHFDYNLVVIGAGSAGLVAAYIAAVVKARVALIEREKMGGDCLNTGCVPSKAFIRSARALADVKRASDFGFIKGNIEYDFAGVMERVQRVIQTVEPHDSVERYTELGVDCIQGDARIVSPYTVVVNGREITTRNIVVATGAHPFVPPIPGLDQIDYYTSDTIWSLRERPERLVVLGGGPIGCELSQAFSRFGSQVVQVEMGPQIMGREDADVAEKMKVRFVEDGIQVLTEHRAKAIRVEGDQKVLLCEHDGKDVEIPFDTLLVAVGRAANVTGFGLEELGVLLTERKTIEANEFLQTNFPNIYCSGDVTGPYQFTHSAAHQSWYATVNALFGMFKKFKVDYRVIPWATFTDPEVARVGLNERDADARGIQYEVTTYALEDLDRAIADSETTGFVKLLTVPGKDKILGVTIMGSHASDIIAEYVTAMRNGLGLNKILSTIHIYPTFSEANKYAAGEWKKTHAPEKLLGWVKRFHTWRR